MKSSLLVTFSLVFLLSPIASAQQTKQKQAAPAKSACQDLLLKTSKLELEYGGQFREWLYGKSSDFPSREKVTRSEAEMLTACSVENARVRKQAEELLMKALATIDISCRLDPTVREFGSPCGKIAPNPEILILHHEFCDTWNKQELGAKPGICSKLMPLEGGKAKPRGKNSSIIGI